MQRRLKGDFFSMNDLIRLDYRDGWMFPPFPKDFFFIYSTRYVFLSDLIVQFFYTANIYCFPS